MENRLVAIETKLLFQENLVEDLNEVVYRQQQQLDRLEKQLNDLQARLKAILVSPVAASPDTDLPPHY